MKHWIQNGLHDVQNYIEKHIHDLWKTLFKMVKNYDYAQFSNYVWRENIYMN